MVIDLFTRDKTYHSKQMIGEFTVVEPIGEGKYGVCYLVCSDNKKYILKQLKNGILRKSGPKAGYEEQILSHIHHERIPEFIQKIRTDKLTGYVLEFKEGKNFEEIVFCDKHVFHRMEIYDIGMQLIEIIKYLHELGIVHRDIRLPNVIYKANKVYLVDFGLARWEGNEYSYDIDFSYFGDFLLHLYYSSYKSSGSKPRPWYEELELSENELLFLKRLMGVEERYKDIREVERDFIRAVQINTSGMVNTACS